MNGLIKYLKGAIEEFKDHVEWPKWSDLQSSTTVVAITSIILAVFCFGVDWIFAKALQNIYSILIGLKS
ncbi:MAG: preprotein translocase subunit SecE [Apibacter sp.]|jgi:preprotein translocase subunit SecE|uniref:Protein translocase subunit SecE n=1 Tax=Apibacter mensalis TaxID=1586267 RepID=A0A0X3APC8_9FLAO|nr:preprotein translocase subunit SecE [Apibacter mensalis]MCO6565350.1 preprotein translocase subunit SecE [Apibacter sp.]CVK16083.1 preprotein translocase subunit SecE [Apibacter mensalis]